MYFCLETKRMEKEKQITENNSGTDEQSKLVLFNDHHNTFEHVIQCLVDICKHNPVQAEQCAMITHYKGKCTVKTGQYKELAEMGAALGNQDLTVEIQ